MLHLPKLDKNSLMSRESRTTLTSCNEFSLIQPWHGGFSDSTSDPEPTRFLSIETHSYLLGAYRSPGDFSAVINPHNGKDTLWGLKMFQIYVV